MSTYHASSASETLHIYSDMIEHGKKELLEASMESDGWKLCKTSNAKSKNIAIHKKKNTFDSVVRVRGKGIIEASPEEILDVVRGLTYASEIDPLFQEGKVLEKLDDDHQIIFSRHRVKTSPFKHREMVYMQSTLSASGGTKVLLSFSVPRDDVVHIRLPMRGSCVRERMLYSGWIITPIGSLSSEKPKLYSEVTFIYQVDPKGLVPAFITNALSGDEALIIDRVRNMIKKRREDSMVLDSKSDMGAKSSLDSKPLDVDTLTASSEVIRREPLDEVLSEDTSPSNDKSDGIVEVDDSVKYGVKAC